MKFLVVIFGLFAIGNAQLVFRSYDPLVAPAVVPSVVPSVVFPTVPETEQADWEAYKAKFGKFYFNLVEDRFRRNIYMANKKKVAKFDELISFGIGFEKLQLDIFADQTRDEIFSLRSILEESQEEWNNYKLTYGKLYDSFEDKFHKTIYFIVKDMIEAHNKLAAFGFTPHALAINMYTDFFHDELPVASYFLASTPTVPLTRFALPYTAPIAPVAAPVAPIVAPVAPVQLEEPIIPASFLRYYSL